MLVLRLLYHEVFPVYAQNHLVFPPVFQHTSFIFLLFHCFYFLIHTEPTDGFHPSQTGNALFAQKFFEWLDVNHPEALGPVNPHNDEIAALFPNQF